MKITTHMDREELKCEMDVHQDRDITDDQAEMMARLLTAGADAAGWTRTGDVEDVDWFRMLDEALA